MALLAVLPAPRVTADAKRHVHPTVRVEHAARVVAGSTTVAHAPKGSFAISVFVNLPMFVWTVDTGWQMALVALELMSTAQTGPSVVLPALQVTVGVS